MKKTIILQVAMLVVATSTGIAIAGESSDVLYVGARDRDNQDSTSSLNSTSSQVASAKSVSDFKAEALAAVDAYDVRESKSLVNDDSVVFVDVREGDELAEHGMIEGAVHVPRGVLEFYIDPKSSLHMDIFSSGKKLISYCATGGRSLLAAKLAMEMGVPDPVYLEGGFKAWVEANGVTTTFR
jgi:rhodanese-related sulfurtransferase